MQQSAKMQEATVHYRGALTDPARWKGYRARSGDVMICTPPKCGTSWTQTIVTMLLLDTDTLPAPLAELSPWVDAALPGELSQMSDLARMAAALDAQTARRCLKTHTPADGIPLRGDAIHVAVYRHPVDLFFSLRKHLSNMKGVRDNHPMNGDTDTAFAAFLTATFDPDACDDDSLAAVVAHYDSFVRAGRVPNLLVLHYSDMLRDPAAAVASLADHIGVSHSPARLASIVAATGLDRMRAAPERYAPFGGADLWHDPAAFFDSARQRSWEGQLDSEALAAYDARIAEILSPAHRRWLETGGPAGPAMDASAATRAAEGIAP